MSTWWRPHRCKGRSFTVEGEDTLQGEGQGVCLENFPDYHIHYVTFAQYINYQSHKIDFVLMRKWERVTIPCAARDGGGFSPLNHYGIFVRQSVILAY